MSCLAESEASSLELWDLVRCISGDHVRKSCQLSRELHPEPTCFAGWSSSSAFLPCSRKMRGCFGQLAFLLVHRLAHIRRHHIGL